jgi:hypothetical protein
MSARVEKLLKEYPTLIRERNCLAHQIAHFRGVTAEDVIESMYTPFMDGERVQTSGISDKTAQIALNYQERMERINREWFEHLEHRLKLLTDELSFFESALDSLSGRLPAVMRALVVRQSTWDIVQTEYHIGRATLSAYRKQAIAELDELFAAQDRAEAAYLLE